MKQAGIIYGDIKKKTRVTHLGACVVLGVDVVVEVMAKTLESVNVHDARGYLDMHVREHRALGACPEEVTGQLKQPSSLGRNKPSRGKPTGDCYFRFFLLKKNQLNVNQVQYFPSLSLAPATLDLFFNSSAAIKMHLT
jgi:hypothetical protein